MSKQNHSLTDFAAIGGASSFVADLQTDAPELYPPRQPPPPPARPRPSFAREQTAERRREQGRFLRGLDAYSRHKMFINDYVLFFGKQGRGVKAQAAAVRTDEDALSDNFEFIRSEGEVVQSWEQQLAKKYYDKLFKEYCLCDLTQYREGKVGFRWRVEREVMEGKGQFVCGNVSCSKMEGLKSFEVAFEYVEDKQMKSALVKCRLCPRCAAKLSYRREKDKRRQQREELREQHKKMRRESRNDAAVEGNVGHAAAPTVQGRTEVVTAGPGKEEEEEAVEEVERRIWTAAEPDTRTREDDFDDYFRDMFP